MSRILIASIVGGLVYFAWGMAAWMVLPLHMPSLHGLPDEDIIAATLKAQDLETGVYVLPFSSNTADMQNPESEFMKKHLAGPIVSIYYSREGKPAMDTSVLVQGLIIDVLAAGIAACLLSSVGGCCANFWCRVGFVMGLGIFVALVGHASYWNWMNFPLDYTIAFVIDVIVGAILMGLAIAPIIRPANAANGSDVQRVGANVAAEAATVSTATEKLATAKPTTVSPMRSDALSLLAALQREARFIDIVNEPLGEYSDSQIGAAARDVLRDCATVIERMFQLQPVVDQEEGTTIELPSGFDVGKYRIAGNGATAGKLSGSLIHHGWQATQCELPSWSGSREAAMVVAPAELEVKS